ncbi:proteoglycan 4-like isoform X1 [Arachis ipaensis]|uniref:proteoglycan 4-like isoform X1 n=1 Tax=Arachis ipaensis TaxID=130454 RepID=UPI0007AFBB67|nr:proteoglycan 4-like isoform X1 [Arachis ipaensis]XP_020969291.1 proteoglycan 4-like isoform X1 [Arachis ipaensis]
MASSVIRFFKIVLRHSLEDGKLMIPITFSMKYGRGVPNPVYLKLPDGTAWKMDWSESDGAIQFENGWKEFASYYSLDHGHLLWFEYNQTSNIEVHIFDKTCLEIDYPSVDHISDDDSIEILNELPPRGWPRKTKKAARKTPSPSTSKMFTSSANTKVVKCCPERNYPSKDHIGDDNMVKVENEPPRRGRGRPRKTEKAAANTASPSTSKMFTSSAKTRAVKRCPETDYPSRRGRGRPRKTEKAAPKTPSACTSKMFTSSAKTRCPEIDYPSKDHIDDANMVKVENEPPRRGRGRPRKTEKAAPKTPSPSTSKMFTSSPRGRGRPRKTEKAAPKTPSPCTSKMFTSSAKTKEVKWCPEIHYPSKDHIDDDNMVENEPPRRGRGRPRKTEKAASNTPSPCTSKMFTSSAMTRVVKWCPEIDYPSRRGRGRPRKTEKAAPKTPSSCTSTMFTSSAKARGVKWWREKDYPCKDHINDDNMVKVENEPPRRGRGRPRKTGKAALKTPSACTSKMFTSSAKTRCPEIDYPSKDHIDDHNMVKVENEPPRRGRGRPRKKLKAAAEVSSPSTSKILMSSVKTGDVEKAPDKQNWMQCCKNEASQSE